MSDLEAELFTEEKYADLGRAMRWELLVNTNEDVLEVFNSFGLEKTESIGRRRLGKKFLEFKYFDSLVIRLSGNDLNKSEIAFIKGVGQLAKVYIKFE